MKQKIVSIFKDLYKSKDVPFKITLEQALERIKVGKSKDKIEVKGGLLSGKRLSSSEISELNEVNNKLAALKKALVMAEKI